MTNQQNTTPHLFPSYENQHTFADPRQPPDPSIKLLSLFIILGASIAGMTAISSLFDPGYVMNFNHPLRQGIIQCYLEGPIWSLPAAWCSFLQAGIAPFQSNPILFSHIVLFFHYIFSLELAYKLATVLVWFLLPGLVAYVLYRRGYPLLAGFAFAFLLLEHGAQDTTGIEFFLLVESDAGQVLSFALFALSLDRAIIFFQNPSRKNLAILSVVTILHFLAHPTTFMLFIPILAALAILNFETVRRNPTPFILYPILVLMLASYFLAPVIANLSSNEPESVNVGLASPWPLAYEKISNNMNPALFWLGLIGLILLGVCHRTSPSAIPALAAGILFAWIISPIIAFTHILDFAQFHRTVGLLYNLLIIGAAAPPAYIIHKALMQPNKTKWVIIAVTLFGSGILLGNQYTVLSQRTSDITTSSNPLYQPLLSILSQVNTTNGRILLEETYGQTTYPVNLSTAWGIGPLFSPNDLIHPLLRFYTYPYAGTKDFQIQSKRIETLTMDEYLDLLETWNIAYVVAGSGPYRKAFRFLPAEFSNGPLIIYKNTLTPVDYFRVGKGRILESHYHKTYARAVITASEFTNVIFKVRYWKNWKATIDNKPLQISKSQRHHMIVAIPEGTHVLEFTYAMRWWDYLGWILTILGIARVASLFLYHLGSPTKSFTSTQISPHSRIETNK